MGKVDFLTQEILNKEAELEFYMKKTSKLTQDINDLREIRRDLEIGKLVDVSPLEMNDPFNQRATMGLRNPVTEVK